MAFASGCGNAPSVTTPSVDASQSAAAVELPDELRYLWIGETRLIPEFGPGQDRSNFEFGPDGTTFNFYTGSDDVLASRGSAVGDDRFSLTSTEDGAGCEEGDVGTYDWSLTRRWRHADHRGRRGCLRLPLGRTPRYLGSVSLRER